MKEAVETDITPQVIPFWHDQTPMGLPIEKQWVEQLKLKCPHSERSTQVGACHPLRGGRKARKPPYAYAERLFGDFLICRH